jgi:hypothetical protein
VRQSEVLVPGGEFRDGVIGADGGLLIEKIGLGVNDFGDRV